jgi:hypothetical protein
LLRCDGATIGLRAGVFSYFDRLSTNGLRGVGLDMDMDVDVDVDVDVLLSR